MTNTKEGVQPPRALLALMPRSIRVGLALAAQDDVAV